MLIDIIFIILGNLLFLYIFFNKLKEDYIPEKIFSSAFYILLGAELAYIVSKRFYPEWLFWFVLVGIVLGFSVSMVRFRLRTMETLEALIISFLPGMSLLFLSDFIKNKSTPSLIGSLVVILLIVIFSLLDKYYKRFVWYRSGRIGFSGLTVLGLFFLIRSAVALSFPTMLSFSGKYEVYLSAIVSFASFLGVFSLARKKT